MDNIQESWQKKGRKTDINQLLCVRKLVLYGWRNLFVQQLLHTIDKDNHGIPSRVQMTSIGTGSVVIGAVILQQFQCLFKCRDDVFHFVGYNGTKGEVCVCIIISS